MKKFIRRPESVSLNHQRHQSNNSFQPRRLPALGRLAVYEYTLSAITSGGRLDPSSDEKSTVMSRGQMTKRQLENWLSNCRRRLFRSHPRVIEEKAKKEIDIARRELKFTTNRKCMDPTSDVGKISRTRLIDQNFSDTENSVVRHNHCTRFRMNSIRRRSTASCDQNRPTISDRGGAQVCVNINNGDSDNVPYFKARPTTRLSAKINRLRHVPHLNAKSAPTLPLEKRPAKSVVSGNGDHPMEKSELLRRTSTARINHSSPLKNSVVGKGRFLAEWNGFSVMMNNLATAAELIERPEHSTNCQLEVQYLGRTSCLVCTGNLVCRDISNFSSFC